MFIKGSKPYYIGGGPEFLEYCYSYYKFDLFLVSEVFEGLPENFSQYSQKLKIDLAKSKEKGAIADIMTLVPNQLRFVVTISGAGNPLTMHMISALIDLAVGEKIISRIYIADSSCTSEFLDYIERECSYILNDQPGKVVRYVEKIGMALTHTDLLIILDHEPFE